MTPTSHVDPTTTTVFERNRRSTPAMLGIALVFAALGVWFVLDAASFADSRILAWLGPAAEVAVIVLGALSVGFGGLAVYAWVRHARDPAPLLVLRPDGLDVAAPTLEVEALPWSEVEGTTRLSVAGNDMLGVLVRDPEAILARQGTIGRSAGRLNLRSYQTPVYVAASLVAAPLDEVQAAVEAYREAHGAP